MKSTPKGWPRISSAVYYQDPKKAITWLCDVFGFEVRLLVEGDGGRVEHSELTYGEGLIMVSDSLRDRPDRAFGKSPAQLGGVNTQAMMVFVDDADAHCEQARKAGATIVMEPKTSDYGEDYWTDRTYECVDLEGHHWWFCQRLRDQKS